MLTGSGAGVLNALASAFGGGADYKVGGYWSADNHDASQGNSRIWRGDAVLRSTSAKYAVDPQQGFEQYASELAGQVRSVLGEIDIPDWAKTQLDKLDTSATLDQMAALVQGVIGMQRSIGVLSDAFSPLGGVFGRIAALSDDAKVKLIEFSGGIEALMSKASQYVADFYTTDEKNAITAAAIDKALTDAGITTDFSSKADWRAMVDGWSDMSEQGLKQLSTLLDLSSSFASISDYLQEQGKTLDDLAASAPQNALVNSLTTTSQQQADLATQQLDQLTLLTQSANEQKTELTGIRGVLGDVVNALINVVANTGATARTLSDLDTGDGLQVVGVMP